jgi:DNA mismatch repair protein MutH
MSEPLQWSKRENSKSQLLQNLDKMLNMVVISEIKNINSKIESLCNMGVIQDGPQIQELRQKISLLTKRDKNASTNSN